MGTIIPRKRRNGTTGYTAQIVIKRDGKIVHREAKTFDRRAAASVWLENQETALGKPGGIERAQKPKPTLADAIDKYTTASLREIGRTKAQVLRSIKAYDIGGKACDDIGSTDIIAFAQELAVKVKPQTTQNYLSHLSALFAIAKPAWGLPLDQQAMRDALAVAKRLGLTSKSEKRERRPTVAEMNKLMEYFGERADRAPEAANMQRVIGFAMFSTRRLGEVIRVTAQDYDAPGKRILVRDMKHPGQKVGNDVWCDLPDEAIAFLPEPSSDGRFFPYTDDAVGAAFTRACLTLGINTETMPDDQRLHFHDLRHEGVSRLFEMGKDIPHVALVSGHRSWASLQRYAQIRQSGDKWKDWKWLTRMD